MNHPEQLIAELDLMLDWRDEILSRTNRAQCLLETIGLSTELHDALIAEARAFVATCRTRAERIPGSLAASRRRAA